MALFRNLLFTLIISTLALNLNAQQFMGLEGSSYSGSLSLFYNPAQIVDSRYVFDMTLMGASVALENNYLAIDRQLLFSQEARDDSLAFDKYVTEKINEKDKKAYFHTEYIGPTFMVNFGKNAIGFSSRVSSSINADNLSPDLATQLVNEVDDVLLHGVPTTNVNFSIQSASWIDLGLTYGRELYNNGEHYLKGAVTAKAYRGVASISLYSDNLNFTFDDENNFSVDNSEFFFGHSSTVDIDENFSNINFEFDTKWAFGADVGAVYEWRPNHADYTYDLDGETGLVRKDKDKHKLAVGFSITDLARVKFTRGSQSRGYFADVNGVPLDTFDVVTDVQSLDSMFNVLFDPLSLSEEYKLHLPTTISAFVDYNFGNGLAVNAGINYAPKFKNDPDKIHHVTTVRVTPRYDHRWFGAYLPFSYTDNGNANVGLTLRAGPLVVGMNDILFFVKNKVYGAEAHAALKIPILQKRPKDKDKDGVSDKMDKCDEIPGVLEFAGCPDTDGDLVADKVDKCPEVPGLAKFDGCPDTDGDGIQDSEDKCPEKPGLAKFEGCPDTDEDGITDAEDDCPLAAGPAATNGCPDRDGDTVIDSEDECPDKAGSIAHAGCPDTDGDGFYDNEDGCPEKPGIAENNGCPYPDFDGDGVADKDDDCVKTPGPVENNGCPIIEKEEEEVLQLAFDNLEFETGKSVIRSSSYESLDKLAELLINKPSYGLRISGHTDNVGSEESNYILSNDRATAVKDYLVGKGVSKGKLVVEAFGETKPIATNDTPEGRQKNRRVEMEVVFE